MSKDQDQASDQTVAEEAIEITGQVESVSEQSTTEAQTPEELTLLLEDARAKADSHWDQLMRTQAQMDNLRKRHERDLENAHKFALERFVNELLPVRDSLEMGLVAAGEESSTIDHLREGTELTLKLFSDVMDKFNVEQINPEGEPFNPELHQAMSMMPRADVPPNTVVLVVQKGYTLNGRLVRPAMVMVSQAEAGQVDDQA
ncbi:nucleotide exchange factor GrpE [Sedimenticola selenatireducens]|uniref:Protein GrpE n=1 Tax=Sedimenticola selenatireducens TaxID=191960 RepID=A0A558DRU0_9GAMM|nr:nucleotide exchange factor GrpE [Sedimenticola selenatireducens]TVO75913.1 nucleotide exchange factor GrpE [Sedimenticola selenatireducens]TVT63772.1 MAG: nucleotide exchange factor GrpE [Sedimenticola selenatireducens]